MQIRERVHPPALAQPVKPLRGLVVSGSLAHLRDDMVIGGSGQQEVRLLLVRGFQKLHAPAHHLQALFKRISFPVAELRQPDEFAGKGALLRIGHEQEVGLHLGVSHLPHRSTLRVRFKGSDRRLKIADTFGYFRSAVMQNSQQEIHIARNALNTAEGRFGNLAPEFGALLQRQSAHLGGVRKFAVAGKRKRGQPHGSREIKVILAVAPAGIDAHSGIFHRLSDVGSGNGLMAGEKKLLARGEIRRLFDVIGTDASPVLRNFLKQLNRQGKLLRPESLLQI